MKVYGVEITKAQIEAGRKAMNGAFTCRELTTELIAAGVPETTKVKFGYGHTAYRVAGRLIDAAKKAGEISLNGRTWHRVQK